ncbi:hypothetical protein GCM10007103_15600 [Salinimicrobium marinum]|uniref:Quinoprotein amine dehydrogenase n=1 Tax=Salinimicrobium marinum TaxID=680283 RepID=A0A918VXR4_9FLAO|nr:DUF5074 domain-containing protein [Salinimicrobium marinum]GHA34942.1 hypothetical protein GCM10007103_15600 [Salinimicrobium marinum]
MKISKLFLFGVLGAFLLNSCSSDDDTNIPEPTPESDYSNGIFVVNEGSFSGSGTITYISNDLQMVENDIYSKVNDGDDLGAFAQSIFFHDDLAFVISNGSNLITVVDRNTFELVGKVDSGLQVPYYGAVVDGKVYVTNLADFMDNKDDYIAVIDVESLEVEETILINDFGDNLIEEDGLLYIPSYSSGTLNVFNPSSANVEKVIPVGAGFNSLEIDDNTLYALTSEKLLELDLSTSEIISEIEFPEELSGARNLRIEDEQYYYTIGNAVYVTDITAAEPTETALLEYQSNSQYGKTYGFAVKDDRIYIGDGGDFESNSFVEIYTVEGELLEKINVGIAPNGFYFND